MQDKNRIEDLFDFEDKEKIDNLRQKYRELTEKALALAIEDDYVNEETALMNRDRVFYENLVKVIELKEKEIKISFTPSEKNMIIEKISRIIDVNDNKK